MKIGAWLYKDKTKFSVWGPFLNTVDLKLEDGKTYEMQKEIDGYWNIELENINTRYKYRLNNENEYPDPASKLQKDGVHGYSSIVDLNYKWTDSEWKGISLKDAIIYELHIGTFTDEGTIRSLKKNISYFKELGINLIELMPISTFPGKRNWGYDGVYHFALSYNYGEPKELQEFIELCHINGIGVILDVVYNHFGPEGNYLRNYGPYFTNKNLTPWGESLNFDEKNSEGYRNYVLENLRYWVEEFHIDGFRLDAIHEIKDSSKLHILKEISEFINNLEMKLNKKILLIAESDLNDIKVISKKEKKDYGFDGQWCDDFHHSLHTYLTKENQGYYSDYGSFDQIVKSLKKGFVYSGEYSVHRKKKIGTDSKDIECEKFIVSMQNHDQIGNRLMGERLSKLISVKKSILAIAIMFLSPYTPMLFMGEEYLEDAPFLFFTDYKDCDLIKAVKEGRAKEFKYFNWDISKIDPQLESKFKSSKLSLEKKKNSFKYDIFKAYQVLIKLKKEKVIGIRDRKKIVINEDCDNKIIKIETKESIGFFNLSDADYRIEKLLKNNYKKIISSDSILKTSEEKGILKKYSFVLYKKEEVVL